MEGRSSVDDIRGWNPEAFLRLGGDCRIVFLESAVERLFGHPGTEMIGRSVILTVLKDDQGSLLDFV